MSAPPFALAYTDEALRVLDDLTKPAYVTKLKKAKKTLRLLRDVGPSHPGLNSHKYQSLTGPNGEDVWSPTSRTEPREPGGSGGCTAPRRTPSRSSPSGRIRRNGDNPMRGACLEGCGDSAGTGPHPAGHGS